MTLYSGIDALQQPDVKAEKAFLRLSGSKGDIADRELVNGVRSISLRGLSEETKFKNFSEHAISLLHKSEHPVARRGLSFHELPAAEVVFKELLESSTAVAGNHPSGISSLSYAFSCLINLSIRQPNDSISSYFDLYPLYGRGPSDSNKVRMKDGSGMLSPDCFFDDRLTFLPRASAVLLVLFNRNHNYIARRLFLHKENPQAPIGNLTSDPLPPAIISQDDEIFETARRINCGHFRNIMLEDVLKPLMGLPTVGPSHNLDFLLDTKGSQLGNRFDGFVESALLYDWSSLMAADDIQHFNETMCEALSDDPERISTTSFNEKMKEITTLFAMNNNKRSRDCPGLERNKDGFFTDNELARILHDATESPAGGNGGMIPSCQRVLQIETIKWARLSRACTLNEYRGYLGLKPLQSFTEWTSDPRVAAVAERMYKSIDNLELYVGLQAESTINDGFQFGFTKTYGLLVDIISRIRSDPSLTTNFTADNLTEWGLKDCQPRPENGSFGAFLPKLLQRTLQRNYSYNSIYGLFPFSVPQTTCTLLPTASSADYDTKRPLPRTVHQLTTTVAIRNVLNDPSTFPTAYGDSLTDLTGGYGYFLGFDDEYKHDQDQFMSLHALIPDKGALTKYAQSFSRMTQECIEEAYTKQPGEIDVARDVINAVCTRWVCQTLLDYQIKQVSENSSKPNEEKGLGNFVYHYVWLLWYQISKIAVVVQRKYPKLVKWFPILAIVVETNKAMSMDAKLDQKQLHDKFAELYALVFHNVDSENEWKLRKRALQTSFTLSRHIRSKLPDPSHLQESQSYSSFIRECLQSTANSIARIAKEYRGTEIPGQTAQTFLDRVVNANKSIPPIETESQNEATDPDARVIANVLGLAVVAAVKFAKVCTQVVDFYMQDQYLNERNEIIKHAKAKPDDVEAKKMLMGYIREAYRLNHPLGVWRTVAQSTSIQQGLGLPIITLDAGDSVYADFSKALTNSSDPDLIDPLRINPHRKTKGIQGLGLHKCPGISFVDHTMPEILKAIFQLKGIRRTPCRKGKLVQFTANANPQSTDPKLFIDKEDQLVAYPDSLVIQYDAAGGLEGLETRFDAQKKKDTWKIDPGKTTARQRKLMDRTMSVAAICLIVWMIYSVFIFIASFFTERLSSTHPTINSSLAATPTPEPESPYPPICTPPMTSMNPWTLATMNARDDGKLTPFEYTLNHPTAHILNFVDVDAKDMTMSIWLDNVLLGNTYDIVLDKSDNCGDDYNACLRKGFSGGQIVIPKGIHTVRVQWAGVETPGPDGRIDWGDEGGRRIAWSRDSCAA